MAPNTLYAPMSREMSFMDNIKFCVGTWSWGASKAGLPGFNTWAGIGNTEERNRECWNAAIREGCMFFDTAEIYNNGRSEELIGEFISSLRADKDRRNNILEGNKEVFIATKFIPLPYRVFQCSLKCALQKSLQRLKLEKIQLYQVHGPAFSWFRSIETWAHGLAEVKQLNLTDELGVSNYNSDQVKRTIKVLESYGYTLASNQIEYSLLHTYPEKSGLIDTCKKLNVKILAYSPLAMGRLCGKIRSKEDLDNMAGNRNFGVVSWEILERLNNVMDEIAAKKNCSHSQIALAWVIAKGCIPIAGAKSEQQMIDNWKATEIHLTEAELEQLDEVSYEGQTNLWQGSSE